MRVTLSRRGDYAIRAMLALAEHDLGAPAQGLAGAAPARGNGCLSARLIADRMHIPAPFAAHVLRDLTRAGLLTASPGRHGGYRLARPPDSITVLRVVDAADGHGAPPRCVLRGMPCDPDGRCAVHDTVAGATQAARAAMDGTSMADLVRSARR
jgi:Rrf2 family protein